MVVLEMKGGGGVTGPEVSTVLDYGSYGISVVNSSILRCLSIRSWIKSRGTAALTQAVICESVATPGSPPYGVNFFGTQTEYFSVKSLSVATLSHSVLIDYIKSTQGHMLRSIPVVHSGNSAHSGKRMHRTFSHT